ncbi:MAG: FxsA family protein [Sphingomonadales bacterium]|nr:FxsA family protein [Sphingomonadales bacterium]
MFLALLIGLPILELTVMVDVAAEIGALGAVLLTVGTAVLGLYIARLQGFIVMARMQQNMAKGGAPIEGLVHGFFLFIAGILLFLPGFVTDGIGALLLIPFVRTLLGRYGIARIIIKKPVPKTWRDGRGNTIIEGQVVHHNDNDDDEDDKPRH